DSLLSPGAVIIAKDFEGHGESRLLARLDARLFSANHDRGVRAIPDHSAIVCISRDFRGIDRSGCRSRRSSDRGMGFASLECRLGGSSGNGGPAPQLGHGVYRHGALGFVGVRSRNLEVGAKTAAAGTDLSRPGL